ncbi:O-antigen ligase family protein [Fluviicola sp.]|uniref:O-antigen ligase family protein n=1 Tax=Fluviicola sp. TaxID=1917219 RepID=UPI00260ACB38|nr:O-antigen ligase family protein [Fluviicola sp.]
MKQVSFGQIFSIYLGLFSFGTLVFPKLAAPMVLLLLVLVAVAYIRKEVSWSLNRPGMFMMLLYVAYLIGIFFSHELANGLKYAEYKLSLLVIPLLLSIRPKFEWKLQWSVIGLIAGTLVVAGIGILSSCNCYERHQWLLYCFSSSYISPVHHPSYFSGFLLFATASAWYGYRKKWKGFSLFAVIPYTLFASVFYFFCLSLAGILFLGVVLVGLFVYLLYRKLGKWVALAVLLLGPVLLFVILSKVPGIEDDVRVTKGAISEYVADPHAFLAKRVDDPAIPGNQKRLVMWTISTELILEHPFGVGTGNVDEYLFGRLNQYGFHQLVTDDLNPHNQYLQTTLEIGIFGLLILLGLIGSCIYVAIKHRNFLLLLLISGLAFNMLFESMLQRQSGVVFYSFWIPVLLIFIQNISERKNQNKD